MNKDAVQFCAITLRSSRQPYDAFQSPAIIWCLSASLRFSRSRPFLLGLMRTPEKRRTLLLSPQLKTNMRLGTFMLMTAVSVRTHSEIFLSRTHIWKESSRTFDWRGCAFAIWQKTKKLHTRYLVTHQMLVLLRWRFAMTTTTLWTLIGDQRTNG